MDESSSEPMLERVEHVFDAALAYLSLEDMMSELLERIRAMVGADTAAILLHDRERSVLRARAAAGIEEEVRRGVQIPVGRGFAGRIAAERRAIAVEDVDHADILNPLLRDKGIRSLLGVPLLVEGRVIGVLHVGTLHRRAFSAHDTRLLQLAADRAALAIENAQLAEQRALTEVLQRTLLPDALPEVPGLRFSAMYLPGGSAVEVGGDWYDSFWLPDGRLAFVIGDVVGRGVAAAAVMSEVRAALRAFAMERHGLAAMMSLLDELLLTMGRSRSATVSLLAFDLETEVLSAVSAGHLPAVIGYADGRYELFGAASGPPLGAHLTGGYKVHNTRVPAGSAVLLCTDGLIERRGEPIDESLDRLVDALRACAGGGRLPLAERVYRRVARAGPPADDVALLAIETLTIGPRLEMTLPADPKVLAGTRRAIGRWLAEHDVPAKLRFDVTLASSEAAANAIEHAYGPRGATFVLDCRYLSTEIVVTVSDRGAWRAPAERERGRGIMIMHELMDAVEIDPSSQGTTVTMRKRLPPRP